MTTTLENGATLPVGLTMTAKPVDRNPYMDDITPMHHWRCTLTYQGRRMQVTFSKGAGHHGVPPTAAEVVECLAQDVAGLVNAGTFAEWASEYGYCEDSRKAERTYKAILRQRDGLLRLLGEDFDAVVWLESAP